MARQMADDIAQSLNLQDQAKMMKDSGKRTKFVIVRDSFNSRTEKKKTKKLGL